MVKKQKKRWYTAEEVMAELQKNPEHIQREKMWEARQAENRANYMRAAAPVLEELAAAGFAVSTVGELVKGPPYKAAVPVLAKWLPRISYKGVKHDIVRTLSVPWGKEAVPFLIEEFRFNIDSPGNDLGWVIGNLPPICHGPQVNPPGAVQPGAALTGCGKGRLGHPAGNDYPPRWILSSL